MIKKSLFILILLNFSLFFFHGVVNAVGDGSIESTIEINDLTVNGPVLADSDYYGHAITNIGDLNGDGINDIAVSAPFDDVGGINRGAIHIHFMNADGSIDGTVEINSNTTNGPALADGDFYGYSITNIGDLNGDGVNDIAVGARNDDAGGKNRGAIHIHFMNTDGSIDGTVEINDNTANGPILANEDNYGHAITNIGDLNGDGVNDIAVGTKGISGGGVERGAIHIHFMNTDGSIDGTVEINDNTANGPILADNDIYGNSITNIGDLNGDGVNDIAVGAPGDDAGGSNRGTVHIHFMNTDGSIDGTVEMNSNAVNGPILADGDNYGSSIANIGDLNGDGVNDIAVGAPGDDAGGSNRGTVHIHFMNTDGSIDGTVEINDNTANGPILADGDNYGTAITSIGDLDGNGVNDFVIGAALDDAGGSNRGTVHIHFMKIKLPEVATQSATNIDEFSATLNANLIDIGGNGDPTRKIEYGTVNGVYTQECDAGSGPTGLYSCDISNLQTDTTYYYRAFSSNDEDVVYGDEMSFTTIPLQDIVIPNPDQSDIDQLVIEGRVSLNTGTIISTDSVTTNVNITLTNNGKEVTFPQNTTIQETNTNPFNFQNFTLESQNIKNEQPESRSAFRLGIEGTNLTFSQPITITTFVGEAFNTQTLDILYQNEGETTWNTQGTCTVENGQCTFQTNHATIYTINGTLQSTGDTPLNINTEVLDTLTMDCYESTNGSGTYDVLLGTVSNPGYVTAGTPAIGQSTCTVTTNDDQGYYLTVEDDNGISSTVLTHTDPNTGAIYEIQDLTPWNDTTLTTENWTTPTTKGLGFSIITFPDTDTSNNIFDGIWTETGNCPEGINPDSNDYAGFPDTPQTIAAVPQYTANHTTTNICYKVDVPASQPSGIYTGSVTYTATSDASSYVN
jgi:hypothetical protein